MRDFGKFFLIVFLVAFLLHNFSILSAQTQQTSGQGIDLTVQNVLNIFIGLACWLIRVAAPLMVIFLIISGLRIAAAGTPESASQARKNFNWTLVGILVILGVYVIIATVANAVGIKDFSFIPLKC